MKTTISIILFWIIPGLAGHLMMSRLIAGFASRNAVIAVAVLWGLLMAVLSRWLIVAIGAGPIAVLAIYFAGMVNAGPTIELTNPRQSRVLDDMLMETDSAYFKREVFTLLPRVVYVIASAVLFFLWK